MDVATPSWVGILLPPARTPKEAQYALPVAATVDWALTVLRLADVLSSTFPISVPPDGSAPSSIEMSAWAAVYVAARPQQLAPEFSASAARLTMTHLPLQYRTTVAHMLAKQTNAQENSAQFIITTFNPQFIQESDKVYGVSHEHRISR